MAKPEKNQPDKIDALYQWLSFELQQAKDALLTELRMSSAQIVIPSSIPPLTAIAPTQKRREQDTNPLAKFPF